MKRLLIILAAVLALSGCCQNTGQNTCCKSAVKGEACASPKKFNVDRMSIADDIINANIADGTIPGAVLCVVVGDKIEYLKAYGNKSVVPDTVAMTTDVIFDMASCSKCVGTTTAFMQMVEKGKVRLTDNVSRFIPGYASWKDPKTGEVTEPTLYDLMTHNSGVPAYINPGQLEALTGAADKEHLLQYLTTEGTLTLKPGTGYTYSCLNFITLAYIIEQLTGERFCDYVQKNVLDVLGMTSSCYCPSDELIATGRIAPTEITDGAPLVGNVHDPLARVVNKGNSGNAGLFASAEDLAIFCRAIMNGGEFEGKRVLSPASVKAMSTIPDYVKQYGRALGWDMQSEASWFKGNLLSQDHTICHTGYTGTSIVMDLENHVAIILLTNRVHPEDNGNCTRMRSLVSNVVGGALY